jgi:hypothetical protein
MLAVAGLTAIESRAGGPTPSAAVPVIVPDVAVIVALPCPTDAARPALLMLATAADDELQLTEDVRFCVLLLL